jgi:ATP-dependent helicase HrpA
VLTNPAEQARQMLLGTRRILLLTLPSPTKALRRVFTNETRLALALTPYRTIDDLLSDCVACAIDRLVAASGGPAWDEAGFLALRDAVRDDLVDAAVEIGTVVAGVVATVRRLEDRLARMTAPSLQPAVADIRSQMARLVGPGFVVAAGAARLHDLLRYLRAIERRLERLGDSPARDLELMAPLQRLESRYAELVSGPASLEDPVALEHVRWMLEELRVSQFAQLLGTAYPVSEKRVLREMDRLAGAS